eukprot:3561783-Rhodomonas_salina.2
MPRHVSACASAKPRRFTQDHHTPASVPDTLASSCQIGPRQYQQIESATRRPDLVCYRLLEGHCHVNMPHHYAPQCPPSGPLLVLSQLQAVLV